MNHDDVAELLGAYALDAVDPDEAAAIQAHVDECPRCAAELAQLHEVAALLANAGSDASVELWDKIAARLDPPGEPPSTATVLDAALADALPRRLSQRHRRLRWSVSAAVGAAAAAAIALLALQVGHLDNRVDQLDQSGVSQAVRAALQDPRAQRVALTSASRPATTVASIVVLPSGSGYLFDNRLQALAPDRTYQLWGLEQGRAISLGLLGNRPTDVPFTEGNGAAITAYAVTAERAGGAVAPTHSPVAESAPLRA
jgi:plasmid stabilization system protein ParE